MIPDAEARDQPSEQESRSDPLKARQKAMDCLARREYGKGELIAKLADAGFEAETARAAVDRLAAEGLQDDRRFAASFVRSRVNQGKGPVRIRLDLQQRRIESALVEEALGASGHDWIDLARRVRQRKFGATLPAAFREKARQMHFLQYRGFEPEQIAAALTPPDG